METFSLSIQTFPRLFEHIKKLSNQQKFELQKSIIYHEKGLENVYSTVMFSKSLTELSTIKNLKPSANMVYVKEKNFKNNGILNTVEKVLKNAIKW